jgi:ribosome maturation factor RimP
MHDPVMAAEMERRVEEMGFELVELERAGSPARPVLRVYIDRPDSRPGEPGVSIEDCTRVSRALEPWLDAREDLSDRYRLEVSSPGVERPLLAARDWRRFAGQRVAVRGRAPLAGGAKRLEGELLGVEGPDGDERVRLRLDAGDEVEILLGDVERGNLVFRWDRGAKPR